MNHYMRGQDLWIVTLSARLRVSSQIDAFNIFCVSLQRQIFYLNRSELYEKDYPLPYTKTTANP